MNLKSLAGRVFFSAMLFTFIAVSLYGQELLPADSISFRTVMPDLLPSPPTLLEAVGYKTNDYLPAPKPEPGRLTPLFKPEFYPNFHTHKGPLHEGEYNVSGVMKSFNSGAIYGFGRQDNVIGVGTTNYAGIGYQHQFNDNFSMNFQVNATKYSIPHFRTQSFGTSGNLSYRMDDNLTLNVFGGYSMMPTSSYRTYDYGGSLRVQITDRFSTEVGVRRLYNSATGQWETIPIIVPAYKFNEKFTLGIDVGSILKYILQDVVLQPKGDFTSPTIRPSIP